MTLVGAVTEQQFYVIFLLVWVGQQEEMGFFYTQTFLLHCLRLSSTPSELPYSSSLPLYI